MKKKSRQIRAAGIQPVTGEEGPGSDRSGGQYAPAWRSPFPRQENTQTGANGVFLKPRQHAAAAPGHQRPAFARIKKQASHINSFFQKGSRTAVRQSRRYGLHRSRYPKQEAGPGPRTQDSACIMPGPCQLHARMRHGNNAAKIKTSAFLFIIFIFYPELFPHREAPSHHLFYPSRRPEHAFKTNTGNLIMFIQVSTEVFFRGGIDAGALTYKPGDAFRLKLPDLQIAGTAIRPQIHERVSKVPAEKMSEFVGNRREFSSQQCFRLTIIVYGMRYLFPPSLTMGLPFAFAIQPPIPVP